MGIDLLPMGRPKPGSELEWSEIMERVYRRKDSEKDVARLQEICLAPYEVIGAPQVGANAEADKWILDLTKEGRLVGDDSSVSDADVLHSWKGHYVIQLLEGVCDGIPSPTRGGHVLSRGGLFSDEFATVDQTSFFGSLLLECDNVLPTTLEGGPPGEIISPLDALAYGRKLLTAAAEARERPIVEPRKGILYWILGRRERNSPHPIAEQIEIVEKAGRWFVFWGERSHPIQIY